MHMVGSMKKYKDIDRFKPKPIFANGCYITDCHVLSTVSQTVYKIVPISYNFTVTVSI